MNELTERTVTGKVLLIAAEPTDHCVLKATDGHEVIVVWTGQTQGLSLTDVWHEDVAIRGLCRCDTRLAAPIIRFIAAITEVRLLSGPAPAPALVAQHGP
ncbi:MAG TPA: hypothetical protein VNL71_13310 [Chloroflexota bacterium]|nr:hypothetical protein [Chloroflexota bacterium]